VAWVLALPLCVGVPSVASIDAAVMGRQDGVTFYVSKLGDGSDGRSWATAFPTIQQALDAIPDDGGGHRIVVRPDTYFEAMLSPAHKGAKGAYNELVGDVDGRYGGGRAGTVVIDSSDPGQQGFKSYDWWGPIRAYKQGWSPEHKEESTSSIWWDRWAFRNLYVTGGDGGIFFDGVDHVEPFSVLVEDCVSIGRAFGGGVASVLSRADEPITYRRCHLWALDFWGDTSGAYVRVENPTPPAVPDAVFEDCTMVGPQCALKSSNFGFSTYSRIRLARCRLAVLNFSQPVGTPTDGIIQSVQRGGLLHVDLEDCTLMGYKVFGVIVEKDTVKDIGYTTKGDVKAYVQFQQEVPAGIHRLPSWPVADFAALTPPPPQNPTPFRSKELIERDVCELAPVVWQGRLCHLVCVRPATGGTKQDYYLVLKDAGTGEELARFAEGYSLASAIVHDGVFYAFASRFAPEGWHDVTVFWSSDLVHWRSKVAIVDENEQLFNSSVCEGPDGFVMAYESNDPAYPAFTAKFARSANLLDWNKQRDAVFGTNRYTACPCIRYSDGYYYAMYLEHRAPRHYFETYITRSRDLRHWELSAGNPVLSPEGLDESINASDPELVEVGGQTLVYYAVGDQLTWMNIKRVVYPGPLDEFLASWFRMPGIPDTGTLAWAAEHAR
jgi:hypothetical protein